MQKNVIVINLRIYMTYHMQKKKMQKHVCLVFFRYLSVAQYSNKIMSIQIKNLYFILRDHGYLL